MVVVSHNRADRLRKCLESLERSEGRERLQLIVVENGSRDGSAQVVEEFPDVQLIRLPKNFGLTKGLNLGWRAADAEYVLFLHEDTEVEAGAVTRLADALDADPAAAAVCPLLVDGVRIHPQKPLDGFTLENVTGTCAKGIFLANVEKAEIRDIQVTGFTGPLIGVYHVSGSGIEGAATIDGPKVPDPVAAPGEPYRRQ